ncbi:MAG: hypothetical protein IID16_02375 [Candidatus Marinimicrobia bacterium]|nr:hypothetical protein [Candidatus Neomarinimicrobiota bacterium]
MREVSDFKDDRFTREDLRGFASEIFEFFEMEGIGSKRSLEKKIGETFSAKRGRIQIREHLELDRVYTISYLIPARGIPIMVNIDLEHYSITVQCHEEIGSDYIITLEANPLGNLIQDKILRYSWRYVREALRELMV